MPKTTSLLGAKSISLIAGAVILTLAALIVIANNSDNQAVSSLVPNIFKKKPAPESAPAASPFNSADNRILFAKKGDTEIYKEERDGRWVVIIDGQESALYDDVANPTFSEDGSHFAFSATLDDQEFVILDNKQQGKSYSNIKQIIFSADGSLLAYLAETENGDLVVVNGKEGKIYDSIGTLETEAGVTLLTFTAGNQIVYRAVDGQKTFIVIDTAEGKKYAEIISIYFSADGKQIAYYATDGNKEYTIINGQVTNVRIISQSSSSSSSSQSNSSASSSTIRKAKDSSRNLSPDIDKQPDKLNPLICGQTTECNF